MEAVAEHASFHLLHVRNEAGRCPAASFAAAQHGLVVWACWSSKVAACQVGRAWPVMPSPASPDVAATSFSPSSKTAPLPPAGRPNPTTRKSPSSRLATRRNTPRSQFGREGVLWRPFSARVQSRPRLWQTVEEEGRTRPLAVDDLALELTNVRVGTLGRHRTVACGNPRLRPLGALRVLPFFRPVRGRIARSALEVEAIDQ